MPVPEVRRSLLNAAPLRPERAYVLYWMTSFRRLHANFALQRAVEHARALRRPLLILEALRVGYPFASDRLHTFVLQGMAEHLAALEDTPAHYYPYVEPTRGASAGLVEALAASACVVVGDDWPCLFLPALHAAVAARLDVCLEVVDSNGLYPLRATTRTFTTAHSFRAHLQKDLPRHLDALPAEAPLAGLALPRLRALPRGVASRWPAATASALAHPARLCAALPIDHAVPAVDRVGGEAPARARLARFVAGPLRAYAEARNRPEVDGTSALSPALHFGYLSSHQVLAALATAERWEASGLGRSIGGAKAGWWKLSPSAEAFIDQVVTWRELAFNSASHRPADFDRYESLPAWARATLEAHQADPRPRRYTLQQLDRAQTHDALWNATQRQLKVEGWFHNALRMLWGKKILEWSDTPRQALATMQALMGRYSLDGRDPISAASALWVLGRFDRAWGPERPIFGKVRYLSSENAARKMPVKRFLVRYGPALD
jgi:deoxyribodipyrimidine photo-lyase